MDASNNGVLNRPTDFFERYYTNDDQFFSTNFNNYDGDSKFSRFKSPNLASKRTLSPYDPRLGTILEERESENPQTSLVKSKSKTNVSSRPAHYSSQTRITDHHEEYMKNNKKMFADNSLRSLSKITDSFFGQNRISNQRITNSSNTSKFLEDEILRFNRYDKSKRTDFQKKSLAEMVDEVILEKESSYFNPDNKPLLNEMGSQAEFVSRGTKDSKATFDPYSISSLQERNTSSNTFNFKENGVSRQSKNVTFGQASNSLKTGDERLNRFSNSPLLNRLTGNNRPSSASKQAGDHNLDSSPIPSKSLNKFDNINISQISQLTNHYIDDSNRKITQRYFLLVHGDPVAIDAQCSVNLFPVSAKEKRDVKVSLLVRKVYFEYTNDWVKNVAKAVLAFHLENIHNRLHEVVIRPDRLEFQRKLEFHTVVHLTKRNLESYKKELRESMVGYLRGNKQSKDKEKEAAAFRLQLQNEKELLRKLILVDKLIKNVDFKITFRVEEFKMDALTDLDFAKYRNKRHIFQIKTDPVLIRILKQGLESGISGFGVTFMTRNSLEML